MTSPQDPLQTQLNSTECDMIQELQAYYVASHSVPPEAIREAGAVVVRLFEVARLPMTTESTDPDEILAARQARDALGLLIRVALLAQPRLQGWLNHYLNLGD